MKKQCKSVQELAELLASSLTNNGLQNYFVQVSHDHANDLLYGRSGRSNKLRVEAVKLALKFRKNFKNS